MGLSYKQVLALCRDGHLKYRRAGKHIRITPAAIKEYLAANDAA